MISFIPDFLQTHTIILIVPKAKKSILMSNSINLFSLLNIFLCVGFIYY